MSAMTSKFPIGFWNYQPIRTITTDDVQTWADCGITLTMSPNYDHNRPEDKAHMLEIMDACAARGIRLIVCDSRTFWAGAAENPEGYRSRYREALADFGSHPAVAGFHIGDEPFKEQMDDVAAAVRIQREEAPELLPFVNLLPTWDGGEAGYAGYKNYQECLKDVEERVPLKLLCYDRYSQMNPEEAGTEDYFSDLKRFAELAKTMDIPFWTTLLCVGHFRYRVPSYDDLRWQLSTALASGCQGILWFMFYLRTPHSNYRMAPINQFNEKTATYGALSQVLREFHAAYAPLFTRLTLKTCYHVGRAWGGYPSFADGCDENILHAEAWHEIDAIISIFHDEEGRKYAVIVNNTTTKSGQLALTVCKKAGRMVRAGAFGGSDVFYAHHDEGCTDHGETFVYTPWLAPGQMNVYRFDPAE
ncbi:MAG: hypothetical protein PUG80_06525 [Eubacteriales bacterium]|nr:hypothetical protein [Eubacteriales bacterium]MDY5347254.1 hypothetical protein [Eubacteriales bacterium]